MQRKTWQPDPILAMIEGVIRDCTEMSIDRHGQSEIAFVFCHVLGFDLLPRLKAIHTQRLYRPESGRPEAYRHLQSILTLPIDGDDQMIKYTTALH